MRKSEPRPGSVDFWRDRIKRVLFDGKPLRNAITDMPDGEWDRTNRETAEALGSVVKPGDRVLELGCGCGDVAGCLGEDVGYFGVDLVPEFIAEAKRRFPHRAFLPADWDSVLSCSQPDSFDVVVFRGVGRPTVEQLLPKLHKIARRVVVLSQFKPMEYCEVIDRP